jgi:Mg-chelatase subunit ChlI
MTEKTRNPRRKSLLDMTGYSRRVGKKLTSLGIAIDDEVRDACVEAVFDTIRSTLLHNKRVGRELLDLPGVCRIEIVDTPEKPVHAPRDKTTPWRAKGSGRTVKFKILASLKEAFDKEYGKKPSVECRKLVAEKNGVPFEDDSKRGKGKKVARAKAEKAEKAEKKAKKAKKKK